MICAERGYHIRKGSSASTNPENVLWERTCAECGTDLRGTEATYSVAELRKALVEGSDLIAYQQRPNVS